MKLNKKKLFKLLLVLVLVLVAGTLLFLIIKGMIKKDETLDEHNHEHVDLNISEMELMKSSEDIFADNDFLIESFNEYEEGDRFYLAGTNLVDYDRMFVFFGEVSREEIVNALAWNYEEIKDKAADDVLIVFMKGNVLIRLFNMKESECGFNFDAADSGYIYVTQSNLEDVFFKTTVKDGIKLHILDEYIVKEDDIKETKKK